MFNFYSFIHIHISSSETKNLLSINTEFICCLNSGIDLHKLNLNAMKRQFTHFPTSQCLLILPLSDTNKPDKQKMSTKNSNGSTEYTSCTYVCLLSLGPYGTWSFVSRWCMWWIPTRYLFNRVLYICVDPGLHLHSSTMIYYYFYELVEQTSFNSGFYVSRTAADYWETLSLIWFLLPHVVLYFASIKFYCQHKSGI